MKPYPGASKGRSTAKANEDKPFWEKGERSESFPQNDYGRDGGTRTLTKKVLAFAARHSSLIFRRDRGCGSRKENGLTREGRLGFSRASLKAG